MFPENLPREVLDDKKRSSEVQVYNALNEQLDNNHFVFYSSPWLGTNSDGSEIDGEADFLIAHAEKGMLSVEVKGGMVEIDSNDNWTSTDRHKIKRYVKNPVNQARTSKHQLLKKLKESSKWQSRYICVRHGVILPHSAKPKRDMRPDMPLNLFAFDSDMKYLDVWVDSRFGSNENGEGKVKPLGDDGLSALDDMLAREVKLRVRLGTNINQDLKDIQLKTDDQIFILREMEANHRMSIAGAAGTGKTILAIEKSLMLAEQSKRVLLLCYNRPLGEYLKQSLADSPTVTAMNFHQYCNEIAQAAGQDVSSLTVAELENSLIDNFVTAGLEEYDAVIIDEGQDFKNDWLTSLEVVVDAGDDGILYIFYDDNQNVMASNANYIKSLSLAKHNLTRNFRNTQSIFKGAERYYNGGFVRSIGPSGNKITYTAVANQAKLKLKLAERIGSLIQAEGIQPGDIAVLFSNFDEALCLSEGDEYRIGRYSAKKAEERSNEWVVVDTIRRFKGLESPVILLVINGDTANRDELLYTGITRAQAILEIFAPAHVLHQIKGDN